MQRREFLAGAAAAGIGAQGIAGTKSAPNSVASAQNKPFKLKYAPHFGMFRNHAKDLIDQLKFMHDHGFRALEDNFMARRPRRLAGELETS